MILALHEKILIMESPDPRSTYVNFYIDNPDNRSVSERSFRSGYNLIAILGDLIEEDLRGLYIYPGTNCEIVGVDEI